MHVELWNGWPSRSRRATTLTLVMLVMALLFGSLLMATDQAQSAGICPSSVTGCTYAERPFALCEGYHGWLASIAGMKGKTFCVVNEDELDRDTKLHFMKSCTKFTTCRALSPGKKLKPEAKSNQKNTAKKSASVPQVTGGPFLTKPVCPKGSVVVQGVRKYTAGAKAGKEVPVWYCYKFNKKP